HLGQAIRLKASNSRSPAGRQELARAVAAFQQGLALFPQDEDLWLRLAETFDAAENYAEARTAYDEALKRDPNLGLLYYYLAKHLRKVGRDEEATAMEHRALELYSQNLGALMTSDESELSDAGKPAVPS